MLYTTKCSTKAVVILASLIGFVIGSGNAIAADTKVKTCESACTKKYNSDMDYASVMKSARKKLEDDAKRRRDACHAKCNEPVKEQVATGGFAGKAKQLLEKNKREAEAEKAEIKEAKKEIKEALEGPRKTGSNFNCDFLCNRITCLDAYIFKECDKKCPASRIKNCTAAHNKTK